MYLDSLLISPICRQTTHFIWPAAAQEAACVLSDVWYPSHLVPLSSLPSLASVLTPPRPLPRRRAASMHPLLPTRLPLPLQRCSLLHPNMSQRRALQAHRVASIESKKSSKTKATHLLKSIARSECAEGSSSTRSLIDIQQLMFCFSTPGATA